MNTDTDLTEKRDKAGRFAKGNKPKNGFDKRPEARHNGSWKKADTPRFKLEKMMQMSEKELHGVSIDVYAPLFERRLAEIILSGNWRTIRDIVHEVYGRPAQVVADTAIRDNGLGAKKIVGFALPHVDDVLPPEE